jgi:DNA-binding transcriptional regulator YdaS (Cro superfamily)
MDAIQRAIESVGGLKALADVCGVTPQAVFKWRKGVPAERCPAIERATNGQVRCEDLRPDVDWAYLRATNCPAPETHQEAA